MHPTKTAFGLVALQILSSTAFAQNVTTSKRFLNFCSADLPAFADFHCGITVPDARGDQNNNGILDVYEPQRTIQMVLDIPPPPAGYKYVPTSDASVHISMFGDLDSDPLPPADPNQVSSSAYYDHEWMDMDMDGYSMGRILDGDLSNDRFNIGVSQGWWGPTHDRGSLWGLGGAPHDVYGDATVPANEVAAMIDDGKIVVSFGLAGGHNDLTGNPYFSNEEEYIDLTFSFEANLVPISSTGTTTPTTPTTPTTTPTTPTTTPTTPTTTPTTPTTTPTTPTTTPTTPTTTPTTPTTTPTGQLTLAPSDDIGANDDAYSTSLPANAWTHAYLRFDLGQAAGSSVSSATLRLYSNAPETVSTTAWQASSDNWSEASGTPAVAGHSWLGGVELATTTHTGAGYVDLDVTSFVNQELANDQVASFEISNDHSGWKDYDAREGINPPQLILQTSTTTGSSNQAPVAVANLSTTSGTAPLAISFDGTGSSDADGAITAYDWNFGDNTTATGGTTSHTFTSPGTYTVTLTVTDNQGAQTSTTTTVTVAGATGNQPPVAAATATPASVTSGATVQFDASGSSDADGSITAYAWDFGDGSTATGINPQHAYTNAGTYTATLTVTDDAGATGSTTTQVVVTAPAGTGASYTLAPSDDVGASGNSLSDVLNANAWSHAFMRFNLQTVTGPVTQATLRVYSREATGITSTVWAAETDAWSESGATPNEIGYSWAGGNALSQATHATPGYIEFDVTNFVSQQVTGDGVASFELSNDTGGWKQYDSRQGANAPQLIIQTSN